MQEDFHYYATYCAAWLAGYSHEESLDIAWSAQFVDGCTRTLLSALKAPLSAATTQLQMEMVDARIDTVGLQDITRIWASFHFLPYDLYAQKEKCSRRYLNKYRLICGANGDLVIDTVENAKGRSLQAVGIAMHVLADTWAHRYFAGTPSLVINNTNEWFYEILSGEDGPSERKVVFGHNPAAADDPDRGHYTATIRQNDENSIMNLGHGRAGHLPDYSFIRYKYLPAWADYEEITKDNPSDYYHAFCQMITAMKYLRGVIPSFEKDQYDTAAAPPEEELRTILEKRRLNANEDWKALGEKLSGCSIEEFALDRHHEEYLQADSEARSDTFLGRFFVAALSQKSMVTNRIFKSGSKLAGYSVDFGDKGFKGIRDFRELIRDSRKEDDHD